MSQYTPRPKRTVLLQAKRDCPACDGSTWRPVEITGRGGQIETRYTRCFCVTVVRLGEKAAARADGKMLAAEGHGE